MRNRWLLALLAAFWLVLSGHFSLFLLGLGGGSVLLTLWLIQRMDQVDREPRELRPSVGLFAYLFWLMGAVVKSNIDLARRILNPALPIRPVWFRLDTKMSTALQKTLYANSITLTPGTLTTEVREDHFMVHAVSSEGADELRAGEMERRIMRLGL